MKNLVLLTFSAVFLLFNVIHGQIVEIDYTYYKTELNYLNETKSLQEEKTEENKIEILGRGFLDLFSNGRMQGTAQIIKLKIGEPNAFHVPVYLLIGASGEGLGTQGLNENTVTNLLNPIGGLINLTINNSNSIYTSKSGITSIKFAYQISGKLINAQDFISSQTRYLGAGYGNMGLFFQTGAWEAEKDNNLGVFWMQIKATSSLGINEDSYRMAFGEHFRNNLLFGYSADFGIEIDSRVNMKVGIYRFINNQEIDLFNNTLYKFSIDYNLRRM